MKSKTKTQTLTLTWTIAANFDSKCNRATSAVHFAISSPIAQSIPMKLSNSKWDRSKSNKISIFRKWRINWYRNGINWPRSCWFWEWRRIIWRRNWTSIGKLWQGLIKRRRSWKIRSIMCLKSRIKYSNCRLLSRLNRKLICNLKNGMKDWWARIWQIKQKLRKCMSS